MMGKEAKGFFVSGPYPLPKPLSKSRGDPLGRPFLIPT